MSYRNFSTGQLTRGVNPTPQIACWWQIQMNYGGSSHSFRTMSSSNGDDSGVNTDGGTGQTQVGVAQGSGSTVLITSGADASWVFVCQVNVQGVGVTWYWRHEGETALHTGSLADAGINDISDTFGLMQGNSGGGGVPGMYMSAYKEWFNSTDLTPAQILAESAQNAPVVLTNLANYMSCAPGSTVGQDTSGNGANWTVTGTITTDLSEPSMGIGGIALRGTVTVATSNGVCPTPAGVVVGDVLVAFLGNYNSLFPTVWASSGWTLLTMTTERGGPGGSDLNCAIMWKVASASEPSSYTFTVDLPGNVNVIIAAYSGVSSVVPLDPNFSSNNSAGTSSTATGTGFSASFPNEQIVCGWFGDDTGLTGPPVGSIGPLVTRVDGSSFLNLDSGLEGYYDGALSASGATGNYVATLSGVDTWIVMMAALVPAIPPAPFFRGSAVQSVSNTSTTISVTDPGFTGDFLLAIWECDGGGQSCSPPDGSWTQIFNASLFTDGATYYVWYKNTSAGGGGTLTFTAGQVLNMGLAVAAWAGVDPVNPLQVAPVSETHDDGRTSPANVIAPTVTTTADECLIVWACVADPNTNTPVVVGFTAPAGYTPRLYPLGGFGFADDSGQDIMCIADFPQSSAGTVAAATGVITRASTGFGVVGFHIPLKAARTTHPVVFLTTYNPPIMIMGTDF